VGGIYGSHSADLLFHIIILELQYIILDSSPKKNILVRNILSGHKIYLLGVFMYWAAFIFLSTYAINMSLN